jgi:TonB family protein
MSRYLALVFSLVLPSAALAQTATPATGSAPAASPETRAPKLLNPGEVSSRLGAAYPDSLRRAGIGGNVQVRMVVDTTGIPGEFAVARASGTPQLDSAALGVASLMRYQPATLDGRRVRMPVTVPITFRLAEDDELPAPAASPAAPAGGGAAPATQGPGADTGVPTVERTPRLLNASSVRVAMERLYPKRLRAEGVGGAAVVSMTVDTMGVPGPASVIRGTGYRELDVAAVEVAKVMRFRPAMVNNRRVRVLVRIPITFTTEYTGQ